MYFIIILFKTAWVLSSPSSFWRILKNYLFNNYFFSISFFFSPLLPTISILRMSRTLGFILSWLLVLSWFLSLCMFSLSFSRLLIWPLTETILSFSVCNKFFSWKIMVVLFFLNPWVGCHKWLWFCEWQKGCCLWPQCSNEQVVSFMSRYQKASLSPGLYMQSGMFFLFSGSHSALSVNIGLGTFEQYQCPGCTTLAQWHQSLIPYSPRDSHGSPSWGVWWSHSRLQPLSGKDPSCPLNLNGLVNASPWHFLVVLSTLWYFIFYLILYLCIVCFLSPNRM